MEPLIECGFFREGGHLCRWLLQRPGVDLECSWDGLCWVLLVSQGLKGAFFVPVCITWLPWGTGDCGMDCFGCALGLVGVSSAHWCLSLWAVSCVSGAVDRTVFGFTQLFPNYGSFWGSLLALD